MSAIRYAQILEEQGHQSICVGLENSPLDTAARESSIETVSVPKAPRIWPFGTSLRLRKILKANQIETVFVHHLKDLTALLPALIGLPSIRLIGLSHVLVSRSKKDLIHKFLYSFLDRMIVFTKIQKDLSIPVLPMSPERYAIIPGFVDTTHFNPAKRSLDLRKSWGIGEEEILIGAVGRLDEQKGQAELLEALSLLSQLVPEAKWKAVLIGAVTASEEKKGYALYVQNLLESLHLTDRVQLLGFIPDPSMAMASFDIFVLPSYRETFGLVILEAMACAVTPVVTDAGGPPEIVGDAGLLVTPKDSASLANALEDLLKHPQKRIAIGKLALERAKSIFSRAAVGQELKELLK